jgi:hypothetical protein
MFKVHVDTNKDYSVRFSYRTGVYVDIVGSRSSFYPDHLVDFRVGRKTFGKGRSVVTYCDISKITKKGYKLVTSEKVTQDSREKFNKGLGRRLALRKALKAAMFSKRDRVKIWAKYFAHMDNKLMSHERYMEHFPLKERKFTKKHIKVK